LRVEQDETDARVTVKDSGQGIDPEFLPRVFDRFRQADSSTTRSFGGLGLGLAIVRHLVELHGGTVSAQSEGAGKGATFTVTFPLMADRAPLTVSHAPEISDTYSLDGLKVLLVDDEPEARQIISTVITRTGAEVKSCKSAHEALVKLSEWKPDVILSDIAMPGQDGYETLRRIRAWESARHQRRRPAIAVSAFNQREDRIRALSHGFQMHLTKPVAPAELIIVVSSVAKGMQV
jgi:CheY-like chemotaxis protein